MNITHGDTVITYNEAENKWCFTLRGRDRSAESLAKAREIIDKVPPEKKKPFEKIPAWLIEWAKTPKRCDVTGIAEGRSYDKSVFVWINKDGTRSKSRVDHVIFPASDKNDAICAEIISKESEIEAIQEAIRKLKAELSPLVLPKEEA